MKNGYVMLNNVIDSRTNKFHSIAIVRTEKKKFFIESINEELQEEVEGQDD